MYSTKPIKTGSTNIVLRIFSFSYTLADPKIKSLTFSLVFVSSSGNSKSLILRFACFLYSHMNCQWALWCCFSALSFWTRFLVAREGLTRFISKREIKKWQQYNKNLKFSKISILPHVFMNEVTMPPGTEFRLTMPLGTEFRPYGESLWGFL